MRKNYASKNTKIKQNKAFFFNFTFVKLNAEKPHHSVP